MKQVSEWTLSTTRIIESLILSQNLWLINHKKSNLKNECKQNVNLLGFKNILVQMFLLIYDVEGTFADLEQNDFEKISKFCQKFFLNAL